MIIEVEDSGDCPFYAETRGYEYCQALGNDDFCFCNFELNDKCPLVKNEEIIVKKKG